MRKEGVLYIYNHRICAMNDLVSILGTFRVLKVLTYKLSGKRFCHFGGGSYHGVKGPPTRQDAPPSLRVCNIII